MARNVFAVEQIAGFALRDGHALDEVARERLKHSILDTIGCAIGALSSGPVREIRSVVDEFGGTALCTVIGGGRTAPDRAALVNGCLVRYLDFMDNYLAQGEVCHPSDNFAPVLAAAEYADRNGSEFMTGLAVAYEVQCRLIQNLPTMRAGLNYTTPLAFSSAAGTARMLGLSEKQTANALAIAGVGAVSLAVIQAEPVSQWKGLASGEVSSRALHNTFLAARGITGTPGVFEGPFGLEQLVDAHLTVDWSALPLDAAKEVSIKRYNAEFQSQAAVDAAIELHAKQLGADQIQEITAEVSEGAYKVLGGGPYGPKDECHNKEQADHNLKYLVAVALLDGEVWPEQFATERIERADVQTLLRKVNVVANESYTKAIPERMKVKLTVKTVDGRRLEVEREGYRGFYTDPMTWDEVVQKFQRLTGPFVEEPMQNEIIAAVKQMETLRVRDLTRLLERAGSR